MAFVVLADASALDELLPFYCPALAWLNARPWDVHWSRLRLFAVQEVVIPQLAAPLGVSGNSSAEELFSPAKVSEPSTEALVVNLEEMD